MYGSVVSRTLGAANPAAGSMFERLIETDALGVRARARTPASRC